MIIVFCLGLFAENEKKIKKLISDKISSEPTF